MELKNSPLQIIDFAVLKFTFDSIFGNSENNELDIYKYPVEVDFGMNEIKGGIRIFYMKVHSNIEKPEPGYSFFIETAAQFKITNEKKLDKKLLINLLSYSIVAMSFTNIRTILLNMSSYSPFGKYILPSVDVEKLIKDKTKAQEEG